MNDRLRKELDGQGFACLRDFLSPRTVDDVRAIHTDLHRAAVRVATDGAAATPAGRQRELVVVRESDGSGRLCRFEHCAAISEAFATRVAGAVGALLAEVAGGDVALFKDKCNLKLPGGGAFDPHQDIVAYRPFGPTTFVTAALFVDPATARNGALEFATDYVDRCQGDARAEPTHFGARVEFEVTSGGVMVSDPGADFAWQMVEADPADVVLFDGFVPHRSAPNHSGDSRSAYFLTFNLARDGDLYATYYDAKLADPDNPMFHVATPTAYERS